MQHVAILNKQKRLLAKIISKEKTIESRWLVHKSAPWNKVRSGETIYFKESGCPVTVTAIVDKVLYFHLAETDINTLFQKYGLDIGFDNERQMKKYSSGKNYCVLIFLKDVKEIEPFDIDKSGYGIMSAWICVDDISRIKKR